MYIYTTMTNNGSTFLLFLVVLLIHVMTKNVGADTPNNYSDIEEIIPQKLHGDNNDGEHGRSLQFLCSTYEYVANIRDDLKMSYVVTSDRISIELLYEGEAWIALGTNPNGSGKMIGSEAWVAQPDNSAVPSIYNLNGKRIANVRFDSSQTLEDGSVVQENGQTIMRFEKLLNDDTNVPIKGKGEVVFIWAIGKSNAFAKHQRRGAFRINLQPCAVAFAQIKEVEVKVVCGIFGSSLFCPLTLCGPLGRTLGLCNSI
jgi:hypothetical protein